MTVKKIYKVGDTVWIYGINATNKTSTRGTVVKKFTIDYGNFNDEPYYVIAIPTGIEDLLEVRTWHTISQTDNGPVGGFREAVAGNVDANLRIINRTGMDLIGEIEEEHEEGPSPEEIHAALEQSQKNTEHAPLNLKDGADTTKRRYFRKRKV
jgi:hypothetical protein